jgi:hypothetical protein
MCQLCMHLSLVCFLVANSVQPLVSNSSELLVSIFVFNSSTYNTSWLITLSCGFLIFSLLEG